MRDGRRSAGFTLVELMAVVTLLGILAAIATPKFASLYRKAVEGTTKGNLGALRSALSIYYVDQEGQWPTDLAALALGRKYIKEIPVAKLPNYHANSAAVTDLSSLSTGGSTGTGGSSGNSGSASSGNGKSGTGSGNNGNGNGDNCDTPGKNCSGNAGANVSSASSNDSGGWMYDSSPARIWVNCTHTDTRGSSWAAY